MRLADPAWLALVALPAALAVLLLRRPPSGGRGRVWALVELTAAALLVLSLAQPGLGSGHVPATVLAIDRSRSVSSAGRAAELTWVQEVGSACAAPCRIVTFAQGTRILPVTSAAAEPAPTGARAGATDLTAGLRDAIALAPRHGRVVVVGAGLDTGGPIRPVIALARARKVAVDYVPVAGPAGPDAAVTRVQAPATVRSGDPIPLLVTVRSTVMGRARLTVRRSGAQVASATVALRPGDNPIDLAYTAGHPGWSAFTVQIALPGDTVPANDRLSAVTRVLAAPTVLVAGPRSASRAAVTRLFARDGLRVQLRTATALPASAPALLGFQSVVLDDVPAAALSRPQVAALTRAVQTDGLGLVALGGPRSFSLGGYARSPLQALLPVSSLVPGNQQRGNVAIELVLDHSGSMIDLAGGVPKIDMVHVAGAQTARYVGAHHDDLGVVDFDVAAHVLVPMGPVAPGASERRITAAINGLEASGGTNIYAGLAAGVRQLLRSPARSKHLILMTDGISEPENYAPLLATLRHDHIAVATVALGADADRALLGRIARATGGTAHVTDSARQLPAIFARETQFAVRPVEARGPLAVMLGADTPVVHALAGRTLPSLAGNVVTTLAPGAEADLVASGPGRTTDPVLAQWQLGLGRVVAWTPGVGTPWAGAWSAAAALWGTVVRWVDRPPQVTGPQPVVGAGAPPQLTVAGSAAGGPLAADLAVALRSTGSGQTVRVDLGARAPGTYAGPLVGATPGVYRYRLALPGAPGSGWTGELAVPYPAEDVPATPATSPLDAVVAATGGRILPARNPGALTGGGEVPLWWPLALAAGALVLVAAFGRLLQPRRAAPGGGALNPIRADGEVPSARPPGPPAPQPVGQPAGALGRGAGGP